MIDGFNLIYKFPEFEEKMYRSDLQGAMNGLTALMAKFGKKYKKHITIIYDGKKESGVLLEKENVSGVKIFYSLEYTADYIIMQSIKSDKEPKMTTVVTSDKQIIGYLKKYGTPIIKSEDFAELVNEFMAPEEPGPAEEKDPNAVLGDDEISFWEKIFTRKK